jgi:hypothetical protein
MFDAILLLVIFVIWIAIRENSRFQRAETFSVTLVALSTFAGPILRGFDIFKFRTPVGDFDALLTWIFIALALIETTHLPKSRKMPSRNKMILLLMFFAWLYIFILKFYQESEFRPSFFYLPFILYILIKTSPHNSNFELIRTILVVVNLLLFFLMLVKYQSPLLIAERNALSDSAAYRNFTWELFNTSERFRGPYTHPNNAAEFLSFSSLMLITAESKFHKIISIVPLILLGLTSSRGSIIATAVSLTFYFFVSRKSLDTSIKIKITKLYKFFYVLIILIFLQAIFSQKTTLTGRTNKWKELIVNWQSGFFFGDSINISPTENPLVYAFISSGFLGLLFVVLLFVKLNNAIRYFHYTNMMMSMTLFLAFMIRGLIELNLQIGTWNLGVFWFICILIIHDPSGSVAEGKTNNRI